VGSHTLFGSENDGLDDSEREIMEREMQAAAIRPAAITPKYTIHPGPETRDLRDASELGKRLLHDVNLRTGANGSAKATLSEVYDYGAERGLL